MMSPEVIESIGLAFVLIMVTVNTIICTKLLGIDAIVKDIINNLKKRKNKKMIEHPELTIEIRTLINQKLNAERDQGYTDGQSDLKERIIAELENQLTESYDCEDCAFNAGVSTCIDIISNMKVGLINDKYSNS